MGNSAEIPGSYLDMGKRLKGLLLKRSGLVFGLQGPAGVGKTYTTQALLRQTPCSSFSLHSTASLKQWLEKLPKPKGLELWAERILERVAAGEAVANVAEALAALWAKLAPVIVHLEDLHEADPERLELVSKLADIVQRSKGVGLLITSRGDFPSVVEAVQVQPLSIQDSRVLLETQAGAELPSEAVAWIFDKAAGNPLFSLEYFRYLSRMGNLWNDGQRWRWREPERHLMPITVEALIEQKLRQAADTPDLERVLGAKAYLGMDEAALAEVLEISSESLARAVETLEARGILFRGDFAHPLFGEVLLQNLSVEGRKALAQQALRALEHQPMKAVDFLQDAGLNNPQILVWLERAADAAQTSGDAIKAGYFRAKTIPYIGNESERGQRAFEVGTAIYPYNLGQSIALLETAWAIRPGDFEVYKHLTVELAEAGRSEEVDRLFQVFPIEDLHSQRGFMLKLHTWHYLDRYADVLKLWEDNPSLQAGVSPVILRDVAYAKASLGDISGALTLSQETLSRDDLSVLHRVILLEACGFASSNGSDFAAAEQFYDQAIQLFEANGQSHRSGSLLFNRSIARQALGHFTEAIADAQGALKLATENVHALFYANAQLSLGAAYFETGRYEKAEELLLASLSYYRQAGMPAWVIDVEIKLGELYRMWSAPHAGVLSIKYAHSALRLAQAINSQRHVAGAQLGVALAEAQFGSLQRALDMVEETLPLAEHLNDRGILYQAYQVQAVVAAKSGKPDKALRTYEAALEVAQNMHAQHQVALVRLEIARIKNDLSSAREHLNWFEKRGLTNGINFVHRLFPELATQSEPTPTATKIRLEVLGSMQLITNGVSQPVRGQKRRELLAMLLETRIAGRREVSRLELLEQLYPSTDELQANTALKDLVYQLREILGQSSLVTTESGYALGDVGSDAEDFLKSGDTQLWRGVYLEGLDGEETVREALYLKLLSRAEALLQTNPTEAARIGQLLCEADPYAPENLRLYLQALQIGKNHKALTRNYARARERMSEVGEHLPDNWKAFLDKTV